MLVLKEHYQLRKEKLPISIKILLSCHPNHSSHNSKQAQKHIVFIPFQLRHDIATNRTGLRDKKLSAHNADYVAFKQFVLWSSMFLLTIRTSSMYEQTNGRSHKTYKPLTRSNRTHKNSNIPSSVVMKIFRI